jgi:hypothetical protein
VAVGAGLRADQGGGAHRGDELPEEALTREQLLRSRGAAGSWEGAAVRPPPPNGKEAALPIGTDVISPSGTSDFGPSTLIVASDRRATIKCRGCGVEMDGPSNRRWCTPLCRARSRRAEQQRPVDPSFSPLHEFVHLPGLLPPGWRLEVTSVSVAVVWHA